MTSGSQQYQPINCSLYDYLEMWSVKKVPVYITYMQEGAQKEINQVLILDLKTIHKAEYMFLSNGQKIRLINWSG